GTPYDTITLTDQLDLARLVDMASSRLKVNIEYDAAVVKGTVTLRLGGGVTDEQLWELTNQLLASRGFTTIRTAGKGEVLSVVKLEQAAGLARIEPDGWEQRAGVDGNAAISGGPPAGYSSVMYVCKNRLPRESGFVDSVKQLVSKPGGTAAAMGDSALLISDLTPRLLQTMRLLPALDIAGETMVVREYGVQNLAAVPLVALAMQVSDRRDGGSSRSGSVAGGSTAGGAGGTGGSLVVGADGRTILIVAPESRQGGWHELLMSLDRREEVTVVRYVPRYFELKEVANLIEQMIKSGSVVGGTGSSGAPGVGASGGGAGGGGGGVGLGGGGGDDRFRIVQDELTGSLLITATASQHDAVKQLIESLNQAPPDGRRPMKILKVRNRDVNEVLAILQGLVSAGALRAGDDGSASAPSTAPPSGAGTSRTDGPASSVGGAPLPSGYDASRTGSRPVRRDQRSTDTRSASTADVVLSSDPGTSAIIAIGEPWALAQVERLLRTLDVRQPQVMVQALVVSLNDSQSRNLGIELEGQLNLSADSILRLSSLFGLSTAGTGVGDRTATGGGGTSLLLSPGEFAAVIRALESLTKGRSVSVPQILVNNNEQAVFNSVVEQPFATRTSASDQLATTSFGGVASAGTVVMAQPQIADGDHLILTFSVELSSFVGQPPSENLPPPKQTNNVSSSVTLPDGFTIAVGGLDLTTQGESLDQVPLISQIPILGEAFKNRSKSASNSKFYVFLRAEVLRRTDFEDLKYLSGLKTAEAGVDDGFPEVEPRMIR
ncbi:MAG: secretin N-terminal domain-containing protein, partial [Phycisphaerales bacterium]